MKTVERNSQYKLSLVGMALGLIFAVLGLFFGDGHAVMQIGGFVMMAVGKLGYTVPRELSRGKMEAAKVLAASPLGRALPKD